MKQDQSLVDRTTETAVAALDWRTKAYIVGGVVGALIGVGAAYVFVNSTEDGERARELHPGEAVGIGLAVLAVLRQIAGLGGGDKDKDKKKKAR